MVFIEINILDFDVVNFSPGAVFASRSVLKGGIELSR